MKSLIQSVLSLAVAVNTISTAARCLLAVCLAMSLSAAPAAGLSLTDEEQAWLKANPVIRVGAETNWAPYDFVDKQGRYSGVAADYLAALEPLLGIRFDITTSPDWESLLKRTKAGDLDLLPALWQTPEREQHLAFSRPWGRTVDYIFTRQGVSGLDSLTALNGKLIASVRGWATRVAVESVTHGTRFIELDTQEAALERVQSGGADAYIGDLNAVSYLIEKTGFKNLKATAPVGLYQNGIRMAVRKELAPLARIIDKAMSALPAETHQQIRERWTYSPPTTFENHLNLSQDELDFIQKHPVIVLGHDKRWPPIDYTDDTGANIGISQDYLSYIAEQTGLSFELEAGERWSDMMNRASRGELDGIMDFAWTEERARTWLYSPAYFRSPYAILSRRNTPPVEDIDKLDGLKVAAVKDFKLTRLMQQRFPHYDLHLVDTPRDALITVSREEADVYVGNQTVALWMAEKDRLLNLKLTAEATALGSSAIHFTARQDWPQLASIFTKAIDAMPTERKRSIEKRWLAIADIQARQPKADFRQKLTQNQRDWLEAHPTIRIGWERDWAPYDFVDADGQPRGMAMEYVNLIEDHLGVKFDIITDRSWNDLLKGMKTGEVDMLAGAWRTPERETYMHYPPSYAQTRHYIFTRSDSRGIGEYRTSRTSASP